MPVISRRKAVVGTAAAVSALGLPSPRPSGDPRANGHAHAAEPDGVFRFRLGDVEVFQLYDGSSQRAHSPDYIRNATVEETRAALRAGGFAADHVPVHYTVTAIRKAGRTVLFDAGTGGRLSTGAGRLPQALARAGLDAVDAIVVSHFHPDHVFGLMVGDSTAQAFPRAEIVVPDAEFRFWTDPALLSRLPEHRRGLVARIQATLPHWPNVRRIAGTGDVLPGIRAEPAPGHTPGHTVYAVASGRDVLLVTGDTAGLPVLFLKHPHWQSVFDTDGALAAETRRRIFDRAAAERAIVTGYHFGFPGVGRIAKDGTGYRLEPLT